MSGLLIDTNIYTHALRGEQQVVSVLQKATTIAISSISLFARARSSQRALL